MEHYWFPRYAPYQGGAIASHGRVDIDRITQIPNGLRFDHLLVLLAMVSKN
jgi:hypothetical protein